MGTLEEIREQERLSHTDAYTKHALYQQGSWLQRPVKTVLDLLVNFGQYSRLRVLDLGCGVGRNSIAIAAHFQTVPCRIDCVDILELAIDKLMENAKYYGVSKSIQGIVMPLEDYPIQKDAYDLILAVSALEHVDSEHTFLRMLASIREGLRENGIFCLIMNSGIREYDKQSGMEVPAQFEVNLSRAALRKQLTEAFTGWEIVRYGTQFQRYDIPRGTAIHDLHTYVVTFVARKLM